MDPNSKEPFQFIPLVDAQMIEAVTKVYHALATQLKDMTREKWEIGPYDNLNSREDLTQRPASRLRYQWYEDAAALWSNEWKGQAPKFLTNQIGFVAVMEDNNQYDTAAKDMLDQLLENDLLPFIVLVKTPQVAWDWKPRDEDWWYEDQHYLIYAATKNGATEITSKLYLHTVAPDFHQLSHVPDERIGADKKPPKEPRFR